MTRLVGLEPTASGFGNLRSTNWTKGVCWFDSFYANTILMSWRGPHLSSIRFLSLCLQNEKVKKVIGVISRAYHYFASYHFAITLPAKWKSEKGNKMGNFYKTSVESFKDCQRTYSLVAKLQLSMCRDDRIWTCDLLFPKQERYQTALHPCFTLM